MYEQYTDEQIVEMLKPKLAKLGWGNNVTNIDIYPSTCKMIATVYRSAYIRGQLGRSFIIGEKMKRASDTVFQVGDGVKLISRKGIDNKSNRYFPPIGTNGEVVELGSDYCFVQWPKNTTYSDGVWACPNHFIEKVSEHWVPATRDNVKTGRKVRMIDEDIHNSNPELFPIVGTVGIVKIQYYEGCKVQWPKGVTSRDDEWYCNYEHLEVLLCE